MLCPFHKKFLVLKLLHLLGAKHVQALHMCLQHAKQIKHNATGNTLICLFYTICHEHKQNESLLVMHVIIIKV